jgi:hypothetical protein
MINRKLAAAGFAAIVTLALAACSPPPPAEPSVAPEVTEPAPPPAMEPMSTAPMSTTP